MILRNEWRLYNDGLKRGERWWKGRERKCERAKVKEDSQHMGLWKQMANPNKRKEATKWNQRKVLWQTQNKWRLRILYIYIHSTQLTFAQPGKESSYSTVATVLLAIARAEQLNENVRLLLRIHVISLYCY